MTYTNEQYVQDLRSSGPGRQFTDDDCERQATMIADLELIAERLALMREEMPLLITDRAPAQPYLEALDRKIALRSRARAGVEAAQREVFWNKAFEPAHAETWNSGERARIRGRLAL